MKIGQNIAVADKKKDFPQIAFSFIFLKYSLTKGTILNEALILT